MPTAWCTLPVILGRGLSDGYSVASAGAAVTEAAFFVVVGGAAAGFELPHDASSKVRTTAAAPAIR